MLQAITVLFSLYSVINITVCGQQYCFFLSLLTIQWWVMCFIWILPSNDAILLLLISLSFFPSYYGNSCYLNKWINFRVDKISRIEDIKFSRGLNFANQSVFHLISFIFQGVLAKIAISKISCGQNFAKMAKIWPFLRNTKVFSLVFFYRTFFIPFLSYPTLIIR